MAPQKRRSCDMTFDVATFLERMRAIPDGDS
jgi:hypothetical protein